MTLTTEQRTAYAEVADVLIPSTDGMPSATEAGVVDVLIDQVLGYRPDLAEDFAAAVDACIGREPEAALDDLAARDSARFTALTLLTAGAYTLSSKVRTALNFKPPPRAVVDDVGMYVDMLADVVERGFHNR